eukprot:gnl/Hemi2/3849_TR1352_c0_g1_i1.p1 gnl/Hemi2/3849_TR1352_c0_g1~~gnl/Hemi2/3849_TR1352_c0_g1_i1.p1  ORF type:complete len:751 (-),score=282.81 gnl/Hemi2/3849_TR1352_c0_g1_i1:75-2207(-)
MENDWRPFYLKYAELNRLIKKLVAFQTTGSAITKKDRSFISMGVASGPGHATKEEFEGGDQPKERDFIQAMEAEIAKMNDFTVTKGNEFRARVSELERQAEALVALGDSVTEDQRQALRDDADRIGRELLRLEKFVNLNYTGCRKILKKHDKTLSVAMTPVFSVLLSKMPWVKGKFTDLFVTLSRVHEKLRPQRAKKKGLGDGKQDFVRKTSKYWVKTEDITQVKWMVLRHLPIFVLSRNKTDYQLLNSVYFDNSAMELYHGRLDKTPNAIALRLRWYDTGDPVNEVYVERKTHREGWSGELSVKERFMLKEKHVMPFLTGDFTLAKKLDKMRAMGTPESQIEDLRQLSTECQTVIESKQLVPVMRTQCMRTAFQIPFDPTVRVSLDTNLCLMVENPAEGSWYRPERVALKRSEITHFPHGVLEVKLQLEEGQECPEWVNELVNSGLVHECHKYSKFIHGSAVLLKEDVRSLPYWLDDLSLAQSIAVPQQAKLLEQQGKGAAATGAASPRTTDSVVKRKPESELDTLTQPLLSNQHAPPTPGAMSTEMSALPALPSGAKFGSTPTNMLVYQRPDETDRYCCCCIPVGQKASLPKKVEVRIEPKLFFANERTFLHWITISCHLATLSIALFAFGDNSLSLQLTAFIIVCVSVLFILYSLYVFHWRMRKLKNRDGGGFDDRLGPQLMTLGICAALFSAALIHGNELFHPVHF